MLLGIDQGTLAVLDHKLAFDADLEVDLRFIATIQDDGVGIELSLGGIFGSVGSDAGARHIGIDAMT